MKIIVPATTSNIGPGFDCLGMALTLYNTIEVEEIEEGVNIEVSGLGKESICLDGNNLVYQSMLRCFDKVGYKPRGLSIRLHNQIPLARGLGSSAASIVGGIVAANNLSGGRLNREELLKLAVEIEGHPDDVSPALLGGLVVSNMDGDSVHHVQTPIASSIKFIAAIPNETLSTEQARGALPDKILFEDAVFNVGKSSLLVAALIKGEMEVIPFGLEDRLHEPYRIKLLDSLEALFIDLKSNGLNNIFLSGAGPTIIMLSEKGKESEEGLFREIVQNNEDGWEIKVLEGDNKGVRVLYD
ncbi:MAG TPA: homoserine kinase [Tepidimicrobium sp.]|nr:homoserine kinase [Tepidimicrobium sp.]